MKNLERNIIIIRCYAMTIKDLIEKCDLHGDTWIVVLDSDNNLILDGELSTIQSNFNEILLTLTVKTWDVTFVNNDQDDVIFILGVIVNEHISKNRIC